MLKQAAIIARKEVADHLRERRSLASALMHLLVGPLVVLLVSFSMQKAALAGMVLMASVFALVAVFTGGMNVAMDVIAGERERRSLLPLLLTPVTRLTVVTGKWLAVSMFSFLGMTITLLALAAVFYARGIPAPLFSLSGLISWIILGLLPLAFLAAALQIAISTVCRTTKEAHTYLSLLIFVPMIVSMCIVFFPQFLGAWAFFVPIAGQQAIVQQGMRIGHWPFTQTPVLVLSTTWFTTLTLQLAGKMLNRDEVVYG
ncbi:MAG: ABC transporter permease subunit [Acidobacteriaceae bacterium]|nr:ABC transporter permease subunit [Acidobacteriaceae bacterium]MBV9306063.1 ABC transporter permease subunit [Acidobacteriaceae bacterium]